MTRSSHLTYAKAGVNIDAGNALVQAIKPLVRKTKRPGAGAIDIGGFGGLFDLKECGYKDPVLVAATDGVGTKLKLAEAMGDYSGIGIDLVAMCVNDLVVQGAEPLFFLDYYATGKLDIASAKTTIAGIAEGCVTSGCALIGGETAEMPGMYRPGECDIAGFAVGAVERGDILPKINSIRTGDVILGLFSSGIHSNGFSLVRHILEKTGTGLKEKPKGWKISVGETLIAPTRIYVKTCLKLAATGYIKAFAHITGGGLTENIPRVLPEGMTAAIDCASWSLPEVFRWLAENGNIKPAEMLRTFNCGIGMVAVVARKDLDAARRTLKKMKEDHAVIGRVVAGRERHSVYANIDGMYD